MSARRSDSAPGGLGSPAANPLVREVLEAEQALLGVLLCEPRLTTEAARTLTPADFYEPAHAAIFQALAAETERGVEPSVHGLALQFGEYLAEFDGGGYLGSLIAQAGPSEGLPALVRQLAASAAQRRIVQALAVPGLTPEEVSAVLQAEARKADLLTTAAKPIKATPFRFRPATEIPTREWLYDRHLIRRFVSATFAPGGVGKTILLIVEALAMATGRPLLGAKTREPLTVWLVNLEDPREELERRIAAVCLHYDIDPAEIDGRLYVDSGREAEVVIARSTRQGVEVCAPCVRQIEREIAERGVDALIVDPFVACHEVPENDNGAINVVVKQWARLADRTGCAIELVHHTRKAGAGQAETTVEDGRGAGALLAGVRSARVLNGMSQSEATEWGITERRLYFRVDNGKANLAPPASQAKWRRLVDVDLENGPAGFSDRVGVPVAWEPPSAFDGVEVHHLQEVQRRVAAGDYKASEQASDWVGHLVADVLGWNLSDTQTKPRVKKLLQRWMTAGSLTIERRQDPKKRELKPYVAVGEWVSA